MKTNNVNGTKIEQKRDWVELHLPKPEVAQGRNTTQPIASSRVKTSATQRNPEFDQPVILEQSPARSRAILWLLMGVTSIAIVWAMVAKIEEAIPAAGKLEPQGTVKEVQAPRAGVVKAIYVEDGQRVNQGDRLLSLDSTAAISELTSLTKVRTSLLQENQFYASQMNSSPGLAALKRKMVQLLLPAELISLTESRAALVAENQLYRTQLNGVAKGVQLSPEQRERLQTHSAELQSRVAAARLEAEQLKSQLSQTTIRLAGTKDTLGVNQEILNNIKPLAENGAYSRIQVLKQQQEVQTAQSEIQQLGQEQARLKLAISEALSKVQNTLVLDRKDLLTKIADNEKRIAEIDSQLTKAIVENNKRIAEIDNQLNQAKLNLQYQDLRAPSSGTVFDLQAHTPGFVVNASQPILKIVPNESLTAKVFITNRDIGFVKEGMKVDVRLDSFPFSEFGDVKGQLVWIGSDALPPDQMHPSYRFPAKIRLDRQSLLINGRVVPLQSGMSVSGNIKVRSRSVMSIFTDVFAKDMESLKFVR